MRKMKRINYKSEAMQLAFETTNELIKDIVQTAITSEQIGVAIHWSSLYKTLLEIKKKNINQPTNENKRTSKKTTRTIPRTHHMGTTNRN